MQSAVLDPLMATYAGIAGHDHELPDLSADGFAERAQLDRSTLVALESVQASGLREQVARAAMRERLDIEVECYDAGDTASQLNVIASWAQWLRQVFDVMPSDGEEAAVNIARRMAAVPVAYRQLSESLLGAARNGRSPARHAGHHRRPAGAQRPSRVGGRRSRAHRPGNPERSPPVRPDSDSGK